jgi:hypothetical protein
MFARNVSIHLKPNMLFDYTRTFEKDVLPLLRRQNGFKDEITFAAAGGVDVTAISLWENDADADTYNINTYRQMLKMMERFIQGTPKVQTSDVVNSSTRSPLPWQRRTVGFGNERAVNPAFSFCEVLPDLWRVITANKFPLGGDNERKAKCHPARNSRKTNQIPDSQ